MSVSMSFRVLHAAALAAIVGAEETNNPEDIAAASALCEALYDAAKHEPDIARYGAEVLFWRCALLAPDSEDARIGCWVMLDGARAYYHAADPLGIFGFGDGIKPKED